MKYYNPLLILLAIMFLSACNSSPSATNTQKPPSQISQQSNGVKLESVPVELMQKLFNECDYTDYIFFDLPFAMSQSEKGSIVANLNYISQTPVGVVPSQCKPIGRQMYHINGEIVAEANVYYNDVCKFYVFVDGDKPLYGNLMTQEGDNFFKSMLQQALQAREQAQ